MQQVPIGLQQTDEKLLSLPMLERHLSMGMLIPLDQFQPNRQASGVQLFGDNYSCP
jgi:hypothetical protein